MILPEIVSLGEKLLLFVWSKAEHADMEWGTELEHRAGLRRRSKGKCAYFKIHPGPKKNKNVLLSPL